MTYTTVMLLVLGFAGILLHNLVEISKINKACNGKFQLNQYLKLEWPALLISVIVVCVACMLKGEIKQLEAAGKWLGVGFLAVGYMSQSILIAVMGNAAKIIGNDTNNNS